MKQGNGKHRYRLNPWENRGRNEHKSDYRTLGTGAGEFLMGALLASLFRQGVPGRGDWSALVRSDSGRSVFSSRSASRSKRISEPGAEIGAGRSERQREKRSEVAVVDQIVKRNPDADRERPDPRSARVQICQDRANNCNRYSQHTGIVPVWAAVDVDEDVTDDDCDEDEQLLHRRLGNAIRDQRSRLYDAFPLVGAGPAASPSRN